MGCRNMSPRAAARIRGRGKSKVDSNELLVLGCILRVDWYAFMGCAMHLIQRLFQLPFQKINNSELVLCSQNNIPDVPATFFLACSSTITQPLCLAMHRHDVASTRRTHEPRSKYFTVGFRT